MQILKRCTAVLVLVTIGCCLEGREIRNLVFRLLVFVIFGLNIEILISTIPRVIAIILKKVSGEPLLSYFALFVIFINQIFFIRFILLILWYYASWQSLFFCVLFFVFLFNAGILILELPKAVRIIIEREGEGAHFLAHVFLLWLLPRQFFFTSFLLINLYYCVCS